MTGKDRPGHPQRRVYPLSGREFPPEVIAVAFAKTSRSPEPFDAIAHELSEDKAKEFHERWVVGYGHGSIAEHAVLHIAIENISRLATEALESCRLCSFTEKSSRYQPFQDYYIPRKLENSEFAGLYREACDELFSLYRSCLQQVRELMRKRFPRGADESEKAYEARLRGHYHDVCRFLLPTAALANVGLTANARALEWLITKLLSHPLEEVRELGAELKEVAVAEAPTLVKYAAPNAHLQRVQAALAAEAQRLQPEGDMNVDSNEAVRLLHYDPQAEERLIAALLCRANGGPYERAFRYAQGMPPAERECFLDKVLGGLKPHDRPPRELEHIYYTFEVVVDQGAYGDLKRHRLLTLTPGPPTVELGYAIPRAIEEVGLRAQYEEVLNRATAAHRAIRERYPEEAAYLVTNAHNRRFLVTLNLRELYHLVGLRSRPEGHFSYRRIALRMFELAKEKHPRLLKYLPFTAEPPASAVLEREYFAETAFASPA